MRKNKYLFILIFAAAIAAALLFAACIPFEGTLAEVREKASGGDGDGVIIPVFTDLKEVEEFLESHGENTPSRAISFSLGLYLDDMGSGSKWQELLDLLNDKGRFVNLNLSECEMSAGKEFNPKRSDKTGEKYIVSLVLPKEADSIAAGTELNPTFKLFENLSSVGGEGFIRINAWAFYGMSTLTKVSFPNAIAINQEAFGNCTSLITFDSHFLGSIGDSAFSGCSSLRSVSFDLVQLIYEKAFFQCFQLQNAKFPSVKFIGASAFNGCGQLATGINFSAVTEIGDKAFYGCEKLSNNDFPEVTSIGQEAFVNCFGLGKVEFPKLTEIPLSAFHGCTNLTDINFLKVHTVGRAAFQNCVSLQNAIIPELKYIVIYAFFNCSKLNKLNKLDFPLIVEIGDSAFQKCTSLTEIDLEVEIIGELAFSETKLSNVNLPNVLDIGKEAFSNTGTNLTITFGVTPPVVGNGLFSENFGSSKTVTVKYPAGSAASYEGTWESALKSSHDSSIIINFVSL